MVAEEGREGKKKFILDPQRRVRVVWVARVGTGGTPRSTGSAFQDRTGKRRRGYIYLYLVNAAAAADALLGLIFASSLPSQRSIRLLPLRI